MSNDRRILFDAIIEHTKTFRYVILTLNILLFPLVFAIVYFTGGTQYAYLHIMYIPVMMSAFLFGWKGGVLAGLAGGFLLGPFMPLDTSTNVMQPFMNWFYRMAYFMLIGLVLGYIFDRLREQMLRMLNLHTRSYDTGIINYNYYLKHRNIRSQGRNKVTMALTVNNYEQLTSLLGRDAYIEVFKELYEALKTVLPDHALVFQVDFHRFWVEMSAESFRKIRDTLAESLDNVTFYSERVPLYLDYSIGISMPSPTRTMHDRFKESDIAAMHAKKQNLKIALYHDDHLHDELMLRRLGELPLALQNNDLFLEYQPLIDLKNDKVVGIEALVRWSHADKILYPNEFIPLAEESRIIDDITLWVFERVLKDFGHLHAIAPDVDIALNISQKNLFNQSLLDTMIKRIEETDFNGRNLHIEMTESSMMKNRTSTSMFFNKLRNHNVKIIIDDFGTGYSSLSCLRDLPADTVKIDRDFTMNLEDDPSLAYMVEAIVDLAHNLHLKVIAEGVEDQNILERLKALDCDYAQGFLYARPMLKDDLFVWLKERQKSAA